MNTCFPEIKKNFGFGMMRLPMVGEEVDIPQTTAMVDAFLAAGFNYFDTAHPYIRGKSELAIRECLTSRYPRDRYLLANKLSWGCIEKEEDILPFFQVQLEACGVDYFDFYLLHAVSEKQDAHFTKANAYAAARQLKEQGKVRHLGFSFHDSADFLDRFLTDHPEMEFVQIQFNYADYEDPKVESRKCYEVCRKHGKPVLVMEPVKGGSLVNLSPEALALMKASPASYAIRYAAGFEGVAMVLSGMSDMAQIEDNLSYMTNFAPLSVQEQHIIDQVRTLYQAQHRIPCTDCRYCIDFCPMSIPIPRIFALLNQKRAGEGQPEQDYAALSVHADSCIVCGKCEAQCPQHLHIRRLLQEVTKAFA
jgi:predicted aldo/keto reductase-like oxidoreductase